MNIKPNLIALAHNISRVYEICKAGNHSVKIIASGSANKEDIPLLNSFYGFSETNNPDITIELCYGPHDVLNCFLPNNRTETIDQVNERIPKLPPTTDRSFDKSCSSFLKTAIEKLKLGVLDVHVILNVANTIAHISKSDIIKVEHVAEAIQYRSIKISD